MPFFAKKFPNSAKLALTIALLRLKAKNISPELEDNYQLVIDELKACLCRPSKYATEDQVKTFQGAFNIDTVFHTSFNNNYFGQKNYFAHGVGQYASGVHLSKNGVMSIAKYIAELEAVVRAEKKLTKANEKLNFAKASEQDTLAFASQNVIRSAKSAKAIASVVNPSTSQIEAEKRAATRLEEAEAFRENPFPSQTEAVERATYELSRARASVLHPFGLEVCNAKLLKQINYMDDAKYVAQYEGKWAGASPLIDGGAQVISSHIPGPSGVGFIAGDIVGGSLVSLCILMGILAPANDADQAIKNSSALLGAKKAALKGVRDESVRDKVTKFIDDDLQVVMFEAADKVESQNTIAQAWQCSFIAAAAIGVATKGIALIPMLVAAAGVGMATALVSYCNKERRFINTEFYIKNREDLDPIFKAQVDAEMVVLGLDDTNEDVREGGRKKRVMEKYVEDFLNPPPDASQKLRQKSVESEYDNRAVSSGGSDYLFSLVSGDDVSYSNYEDDDEVRSNIENAFIKGEGIIESTKLSEAEYNKKIKLAEKLKLAAYVNNKTLFKEELARQIKLKYGVTTQQQLEIERQNEYQAQRYRSIARLKNKGLTYMNDCLLSGDMNKLDRVSAAGKLLEDYSVSSIDQLKEKFKSESRIFRFRRYGYEAFTASKEQKDKMLDAYYEKKMRRAHLDLQKKTFSEASDSVDYRQRLMADAEYDANFDSGDQIAEQEKIRSSSWFDLRSNLLGEDDVNQRHSVKRRTWAIESVGESISSGVFFMSGVITAAISAGITAVTGFSMTMPAVAGPGKEVMNPLIQQVAPLVNHVAIPGLVGSTTVATSSGSSTYLSSCASSFFAKKESPAKSDFSATPIKPNPNRESEG